jgi:hypothetical protein
MSLPSLISSIYFAGVDLKKIKDCVGDPHADVDNPVLKAEQDAQVGFLKCKLFYDILVQLFRHFMLLDDYVFILLQLRFQIGKESRGDVTILPTLVINNRQYRGMKKLL